MVFCSCFADRYSTLVCEDNVAHGLATGCSGLDQAAGEQLGAKVLMCSQVGTHYHHFVLSGNWLHEMQQSLALSVCKGDWVVYAKAV